MGTHRNPSSRVIGVHGLPTPVISMIQEQSEVRGLFRDPLPDVTHGLRTDVVSTGASPSKRDLTRLGQYAEKSVVVYPSSIEQMG